MPDTPTTAEIPAQRGLLLLLTQPDHLEALQAIVAIAVERQLLDPFADADPTKPEDIPHIAKEIAGFVALTLSRGAGADKVYSVVATFERLRTVWNLLVQQSCLTPHLKLGPLTLQYDEELHAFLLVLDTQQYGDAFYLEGHLTECYSCKRSIVPFAWTIEATGDTAELLENLEWPTAKQPASQNDSEHVFPEHLS